MIYIAIKSETIRFPLSPLLSHWRQIESFSGTEGRPETAAAGRLSLLMDWVLSDQNSGSKGASIMTYFNCMCHSVVGEKS